MYKDYICTNVCTFISPKHAIFDFTIYSDYEKKIVACKGNVIVNHELKANENYVISEGCAIKPEKINKAIYDCIERAKFIFKEN